MNKIESQCAQTVLMIRPAHFAFNTETATSNTFQTKDESTDQLAIATTAIEEFDRMVDTLRQEYIEVLVYDDTPSPQKPDAIFPNNWLTTHADSTLITYPMYTANRRIERREDIIDDLTQKYKVRQRYSFESSEEDGLFLEGTGSMILDRESKIVYACLSPRTDPQILDRFALLKRYKKVLFHAINPDKVPVYHTNVIMALGIDHAILCLECIPDDIEKNLILQSLESTQKECMVISWDQVLQFAGNMLQVQNKFGDYYWILSSTAYDSLTQGQKNDLSKRSKLLPVSIPTIEKYGGGSVRCMLAEIMF